MKTLCWTLLLLILSPCVCAAAFGVNVTQRHYQAEETHSITLEWTFTTHPHRPWTVLMAYCELIIGVLRPGYNSSLLIEFIHDGHEPTEFVGEQFSGRVQMDREALREGRIRLHVSRLRTEDSGWYLCEVKTDHGSDSERCRLNVTAAADHPEPPRRTKGPELGSPGWQNIIKVTASVVAAALIVLILVLCLCLIKASKREKKYEAYVEEKSKLNQPKNRFSYRLSLTEP